jgi:predicted methyltransferase
VGTLIRIGSESSRFLLSSVLILVGGSVAFQVFNTLNQLDAIERERDQWQHPSEIIRLLDLKEGSVVADLGCGSGYFTLKLSAVVGDRGRVLAIDLRRLSLWFLWMRTIRRNEHNVSIIRAAPDDPHLGPKVDAVLLVNTYHELTEARAVLNRVFQSLVSGGRLVVADRSPQEGGADIHEIAAKVVQEQLIQAGFEVVNRQDNLLEQPREGAWWLIVARKPRTGALRDTGNTGTRNAD